jgi:hypothetical protein
MTNTLANDVTVFNVEIVKITGHSLDVRVEINDKTPLIAFAERNTLPGAAGWRFCVLHTGFGEFANQALMLELIDPVNGLTMAEVKRRAYILGGLYLASRTVTR